MPLKAESTEIDKTITMKNVRGWVSIVSYLRNYIDTNYYIRALDARNLQILCMVFHDCQIMSPTQKLSQNNTPEPFNRVLVAFFDP